MDSPFAEPSELPARFDLREIPFSATLACAERCDKLRCAGREVHRMCFGESPFPVPDSVVEALRNAATQNRYLSVAGLKELRQAVGVKLGRSHEDVLIGPGSKELMFVLQLVYPGDVIIPRPCWLTFALQSKLVGRRVMWVETKATEGWKLSTDALEQALAACQRGASAKKGHPPLVYLNTPNNPTGVAYTDAELKALATVARKYGVLVLSDEIYSGFHHANEHRSIVTHYPEGTIVSDGLSKWCGAGGWRLGVFSLPPGFDWLRDGMLRVGSDTYSSASTPVQYAAVEAYRGGVAIGQYLDRARGILGALLDRLWVELEGLNAHVVKPEGAYYLFPDFEPMRQGLASRGIETGAQLTEQIHQELGIAVLPGSDYGMDASSLTFRIAYVNFDGARMLGELSTNRSQKVDRAFIENHCAPVIQATQKLVGWLSI